MPGPAPTVTAPMRRGGAAGVGLLGFAGAGCGSGQCGVGAVGDADELGGEALGQGCLQGAQFLFAVVAGEAQGEGAGGAGFGALGAGAHGRGEGTGRRRLLAQALPLGPEATLKLADLSASGTPGVPQGTRWAVVVVFAAGDRASPAAPAGLP